jgi:hypothetical protein
MAISKYASDIIDRILQEVNKEENMTKIHTNLVDPLIEYTFKRLYPYMMISGIIFLLTFLLAVLILILLIKNVAKI